MNDDLLNFVQENEFIESETEGSEAATTGTGEAVSYPQIETDPIVSDNSIDYTELINEINRLNDNLERENDNDLRIIQELQRVNLYSSNVSVNDIDDQTEYIAETSISENNIMTKHINDYTVEESLLFFIAGSLLVAGIYSFVRKGMPVWK